MNEYLKKYHYIKEQLTYLKTKVEVDNNLGLYDINTLSESLFSNLLNDVYNLRLSNINKIEHLNFPAIDLIDENNNKVFQVTSTITTTKIRNTIKLWKESNYKDLELNFFYIKGKPKLNRKSLLEFEEDGVFETNLFDTDDMLSVIESDSDICEKVYATLSSHLDTLSFEFNLENYFNKFESHLQKDLSFNYKLYKAKFFEFIESKEQILEIYSSGGNGKSHLLYELSKELTEYIPLIFKKNINISEDLKKLSKNKKYLFIFDDIDRFLDTDVFVELLSYIISNPNTKLLITYRKASRTQIKSFYRKYTNILTQELEIVWSDKNIKELIRYLRPTLDDKKVNMLKQQFNNNPYLITQALEGDINSIKDFSLKTIQDTKSALVEYDFSMETINKLLFKLAILSPLHENNIEQLQIGREKDILDKLESTNILRKLGKRYRFNPDIIGDLFLAYYIDEFRSSFKEIIENYLNLFSQTVFTNIGYALLYLKDRKKLNSYIENIIDDWMSNNHYSSYNLQLINRVVGFVPEKSFTYLYNCTKYLKPKENEHIQGGVIFDNISKVSISPDYNKDRESINLGSIEPIISKLIYMLKNNYQCESISIKDILDYLTSDTVLNLPKPYYSNHELSSILTKLFSPLRTTNYEIILDAIDVALDWIKTPINIVKVKLFEKAVVNNLLSVIFFDDESDGLTYTLHQKLLDTNHKYNMKILHKVKNIVLDLFTSKNEDLLLIALNCIRINAYDQRYLSKDSKVFYDEIKKEFINKVFELLQNQANLSINIVSKIDEIALNILRFDNEKDEALEILKRIIRTDEFVFYQVIENKDFIIDNYDTFYKNFQKNDDLATLLDSQRRKKHFNEISKEILPIIKRLSLKLKAKDILMFINSLNFSNWSSYNKLLTLLDIWFDNNNSEIILMYQRLYNDINNERIKNIFKELLLKKGFLKLSENDINDDTSIEDLKIYEIIIFKNFNDDKILLLNKLVETIKKKSNEILDQFINIISGDIYFQLQQNIALIDIFKKYILSILELKLKYKFHFESYLLYSLEIIKDSNKLDEDLKDLLFNMINDCEYSIDRHDLLNIYKLLDIGLDLLLDNIYKKLISKKEDGYYRYFFHLYMEHRELEEVKLLDDYVKSYDDFKIVTEKSYKFYNEFIEYSDDTRSREIRIDLDWFFKYIVNKDYLKKFFNELYVSEDIDKIKVFYKIVPISLDNIDLISKNMNLLSDKIDDIYLMNYLNQINKIKLYSRGHMQNSDMVLNEEKLFNELYNKVESFSLRIKIKEKIKNIDLEKRREIEEDIEKFMDR
ncbi:SMEK domain-containing protein [Aliarcobacter butzleri]|uniref:SMEK domain-containing protein n=1 Tax=Aliarcobacter butzleri TaxID=28197 RepID=UPI00344D7DDA